MFSLKLVSDYPKKNLKSSYAGTVEKIHNPQEAAEMRNDYFLYVRNERPCSYMITQVCVCL